MKYLIRTAIDRNPLYTKQLGGNQQAVVDEIIKQVKSKTTRGFDFKANQVYIDFVQRQDAQSRLNEIYGDFNLGSFTGPDGTVILLILTIQKD